MLNILKISKCAFFALIYFTLWMSATPSMLLANEILAVVPPPVTADVQQLRHAIGTWDVETDYIGPDENIVGTVNGVYNFRWVIPDKIASGTSVQPELNQTSAILFFLRPKTNEIEMTSVGADGYLWRMIGPADGEIRTTPDMKMDDGSNMMLRFTRHSVTPDSFGSTMEISSDGGATWHAGNRQRFRRQK